jgi:colicin import membrane protein
MSAVPAALFEERLEPGEFTSAVLAAAVHLALLAILVFGVRWQNRPAESVTVELWEPPPPAPVVEAPKPVPQPEPPPVEVKPEPVKPEPVVPKPEIIEKKAPSPKPKPVPQAAPKPVPKAEPLKPRVDDTQRRIREQLAREEVALNNNRELQRIKDQLANDATAARTKALASWISNIQSHIRNRINKDIADAVPGNPSSEFVVTLLPNCEVLKITLQKSSGNKAYDNEVERAILRASPLPRPDKAEVFDRELRLTFRPKDKAL